MIHLLACCVGLYRCEHAPFVSQLTPMVSTEAMVQLTNAARCDKCYVHGGQFDFQQRKYWMLYM